jgi:hypothetical protein
LLEPRILSKRDADEAALRVGVFQSTARKTLLLEVR